MNTITPRIAAIGLRAIKLFFTKASDVLSILIVCFIFSCGSTYFARAQDTWTQKADFGGISREQATSFSIGSKGYIGTGNDYIHGYRIDFWEYDPATDTWTQKADFGGTARWRAVGFSIDGKGYIGTGAANDGNRNDFWEYDPATNSWTEKANFGGTARAGAFGFSIGSKGYIGTGYNYGGVDYYNDFWEYDPSTDHWTQKANFGGTPRNNAVGFSIINKGYIGTGVENFDYKNDFWEYDPPSDIWTRKTDFGGTARAWAVGFSIVNKGYIGTGEDNVSYPYYKRNDFWEYDPVANVWTQKADFTGTERLNAVGFCIGNRGYIGTGHSISELEGDFWQYTPICNGFTLYADDDGDGYGDISNSYFSADCIAPIGYVYNSTDCNDANGSIHPGICDPTNGNGIDDNCDGIIDNGAGTTTYYADADGDGYGAGSGTPFCSNPGSGYSHNNTDCDDANASINPGATEVLNGIDDNCNGTIDDVGCFVPTNPSVNKITGTTAKLKWDEVIGAEGYKVRYKIFGSTEWKKGTTYHNGKPISGLSPNTAYIWQVETFCQVVPGVMSDWSAKQYFTTSSARVGDEDAVTLGIYPNPVSENFTIDLQINSSADQSADIFLLNALGQIVYSEKVVSGSGELEKEITMPSTAASGWYVVRVVMKDQVIEKKLLYQK